MGSKINRKARINRHLRIFKENLTSDSGGSFKNIGSNYSYNLVLFFIVFLIPVYPTLASFVHNNTQYDFYRGNIDEASIIGSFYGENIEVNEDAPLLESSNSFLSINTILDDERDLEGTNEILDYEVKPGESFYGISYKFKVSTNSIYWANDFSKNHTLRPGDIIKIPPVSGLLHDVKKGDTLLSLAKTYNIEAEKILSQNKMSSTDSLTVGEILVIPGAKKIIKAPVYKKPAAKALATSAQGGTGYNFAKYASSQYVTAGGKYKLTPKPSYHTFYWGNCTYYVAKYKTVNWGGNANQWLKNAKAKGRATGSHPEIGAIVVFNGTGYNPRYGHVGIVMDIKDGNIIVSDMNYRRINEVTYRKVPVANRSISGYIYGE